MKPPHARPARVQPGPVRARSHGAVSGGSDDRLVDDWIERIDRVARPLGWVVAGFALGFIVAQFFVAWLQGGLS